MDIYILAGLQALFADDICGLITDEVTKTRIWWISARYPDADGWSNFGPGKCKCIDWLGKDWLGYMVANYFCCLSQPATHLSERPLPLSSSSHHTHSLICWLTLQRENVTVTSKEKARHPGLSIFLLYYVNVMAICIFQLLSKIGSMLLSSSLFSLSLPTSIFLPGLSLSLSLYLGLSWSLSFSLSLSVFLSHLLWRVEIKRCIHTYFHAYVVWLLSSSISLSPYQRLIVRCVPKNCARNTTVFFKLHFNFVYKVALFILAKLKIWS